MPPTMETVRVGFVQMTCGVDPRENLDAALAHTRQAVELGAQIVCLPELFLSHYFCQTEDYARFDLAEPIPGPTTEAFSHLAAQTGATIILSLFERRARGLYHNTAAIVDGPAGYLGKYRKMHIPDDPRYYEKFYFTPGDLGFKAFDTRHGRLGVLICWDQWFPEAARLTALQGADILFYPTAIGWHPEEQDSHGSAQLEAWELVQRSHAVANGCFVVAVNRTGFEPTPGSDPDDNEGIRFWGRSFVAAPDGSVIAQATTEEEAVRVVSLDLSLIETTRRGWPFLRDRRIDAYADLQQRFLHD